ncbi:MAG: maltose/maltodextrin ABC transporter substrate-binding protein MalE [Phototrophicaceae bacterium]
MAVVAAMLLGTLNTVLAQGNVLTIWADNERAPLLQELADDVLAELGIELEIVEMGLGDARDQLLVAGPVGEGPDILVSAHDSIGQFVANGAIVPLDRDTFADEFASSGLDLFTFNNELYGVPYAIENVALIRNVDLVPEAPTSWEEVRALAEAFQESGDADYAFVVQTGNTYHNFPITSAFGGYIFGRNDDGSFNTSDLGLNSEGGLASAEWLSGMYVDGLMPPDVNDDVAFQLFEDGAAAMLVTGPWYSQRIQDTGINYSIDVLPVSGTADGEAVGAPFAGGQGFVVSAFSENQLLAEIFLTEYVASTDFMQAIFDDGGRPPAFLDVDTSADVNVSSFQAAGESAIPMPAIPEMGAVWASSDAALTLISQGEDAVASYNDAVSQIADAIQIVQSDARIVGLAGSLQAAAGCAGDWDPACEVTFMNDDDGDGIYTLTLTLPAGEYEYKVAMNGGWDENYGADGVASGDNIPLVLEEETEVTFTYDDSTNIVTDSVNSAE